MNLSQFKKKLVVGQEIRIVSPFGGVMTRDTVIKRVQTTKLATPSPRRKEEDPDAICWLDFPKASMIDSISDNSMTWTDPDWEQTYTLEIINA